MPRGQIFLYDPRIYNDSMGEKYPNLWKIHGDRDGVIIPFCKEKKLFAALSLPAQGMVLNEVLDYMYDVRKMNLSREAYQKWTLARIPNREAMTPQEINLELYERYFRAFRNNKL